MAKRDPLEKMAGLLTVGEREALEELARPFRVGWQDVPQLVRVVEDLAIMRRVAGLLEEGEQSARHALTRASREFDMVMETTRYRWYQANGRRSTRRGR